MLGNVRAELIENEISLNCSKSFIEQSNFSLKNSKSIFVPNEFSSKIRFHQELNIFSSQSQEKTRISVKYVCITFAQYCRMLLVTLSV